MPPKYLVFYRVRLYLQYKRKKDANVAALLPALFKVGLTCLLARTHYYTRSSARPANAGNFIQQHLAGITNQ
jgi:hypothetical protein